MAKLAGIFVSDGRQRLVAALIGVVASLAMLALLYGLAAQQVSAGLREQAEAELARMVRLRDNALVAFDALREQVTANPCSAEFQEQMRKVAYLQDGLNEFLYAPGGVVQCSVNRGRFDEPVPLGEPDVSSRNAFGISLWMDRELSFLGLDGLTGSIGLREPFAIVVPRQDLELPSPGWMHGELIARAPDGRWWHRGGEAGIYQRHQAAARRGTPALLAGSVTTLSCDEVGVHCIAAEARIADLAAFAPLSIGVALLFAAAAGSSTARVIRRLFRRYWSFEARFRRNLDAGSIRCAYQPILHLESGEITGCEVLARWCDIDDSLVYPDRFIDVVERYQLTEPFTRLVAERACADLATLPKGRRLQANFNIFPCDLDAQRLRDIFIPFEALREQIQVAVEIVESDAVQVERAQRTIEALRAAGILTFMDDFGTGYSSIHNLAALSLDGVKLDRAFGMAPNDSLIARMLAPAIEMVKASGRVVVVEGVETAERLAQLREAFPEVDYAQGYFISRPLDAGGFASFLQNHDAARKAGLQAA